MSTGILTTTQTSISRHAKYRAKYEEGVDYQRTYDQFAFVYKEAGDELTAGSSIVLTMPTSLVPRPTTAVGNQTSDLEAQRFAEASATITFDYYNDGLKMHEKAQLESDKNVEEEAARQLGINMGETIDGLARRQATHPSKGIHLWKGTHTTRATLIGTTSADNMKAAIFKDVVAISGMWQLNKLLDGSLICVMSDEQYADLLTESSSAILTRSAYTEEGAKIMYNWEVAQLYGVKILKSPYSKRAWGAGAALATDISTTISSAVSAGDTTMTVAANTNIAAGQWLTIGTAESSAETDTTLLNENVRVISVAATVITIAGEGPFGGFKYDHASSSAVTGNWSAHIATFGGPRSLAKVYSKSLGEYGEMVGPDTDGIAHQWKSWGWKWHGGYAVTNNSWLLIAETASTMR